MKKENADKFSKNQLSVSFEKPGQKMKTIQKFFNISKKSQGKREPITYKIWSEKRNNIFVAWIREHSYVTSAQFSDTPTHYISIDPAKTAIFWTHPASLFADDMDCLLLRLRKYYYGFLLHIWLNINRINDSNLFIFKYSDFEHRDTNYIGRNILGNRTSSRRGNKIRLQLRLCTYKQHR